MGKITSQELALDGSNKFSVNISGDADTLDGSHASAFATSGHNHSGTYEPVMTKGNLTEATSSVLTITGGTGAQIGSGTTIQVKQASSSQSGYLSSTDWSTFNGKQAALGYTPINKAGDTGIGALTFTNGAINIGTDSNGAIEIGDSTAAAGTKTPFIDFHYAKGATQDYNIRVINDADNQLSISGATLASTVLKVGGNTVWHAGNLAFGSGAANMATGNHNHAGVYKLTNGASIADFNAGLALTDGEYAVGSASAIPNAPYATAIYGKLKVMVNDGGTHNNSTNWIWHYFDDTSGKTFYRYKVNAAAWSAWVNITTMQATANSDGYFDKSATAPTGTTRLNYSGNLYATKIYNAVYNDYAEYFEKGEELEPGDVVILDENSNEERYIKSNEAYSKFVVGVVSDEYGQCLGGKGDGNDDENYSPIGMSGRVKVKVIGEVNKGDLLVSSNITGVAMASKDSIMGTVIGKALENHTGDSIDRIRMLILNA